MYVYCVMCVSLIMCVHMYVGLVVRAHVCMCTYIGACACSVVRSRYVCPRPFPVEDLLGPEGW